MKTTPKPRTIASLDVPREQLERELAVLRAPELTLAHVYSTPDHRVWLLTRVYLDASDVVWRWDGEPYDPVAGPQMAAEALAGMRVALVALVDGCALHSDTRISMARGALTIQAHDVIEAGLTDTKNQRPRRAS